MNLSSTIDCSKLEMPDRRLVLRLLGLAGLLLCSLSLPAAEPAKVSFSFDFPGSDPDHYSLVVTFDGHASYESKGKVSIAASDLESYQAEFSLSDATRMEIFDLAARAHYFSGKIDSGNKKIAFGGAKTLTYTDGQKNFSADYNYSPQPAVQRLTTLFQSISTTLEFGRRLAYDHRYQKLALDEELKRMEDQARAGDLAELQAVKLVLQAIYEDASVINVVRARAGRLMEMSPGASARR